MQETYVLHVTKECNMNCLYCYEDDKTSTYNWEEIKNYLDNMLQYAPQEFFLEFLGGEPMLAFSHIERVVDYLKDGPFSVKYGITTNGTILNDSHVKWLVEHKDKVTFAISVDGPGMANMFRLTKENKSSWPICVKNIRRLMKEGFLPTVHIVSHPYNVAYLANSIKVLYDLGIRIIGLGIVEKTIKIDQRYCNELERQMQEVSDLIKNGSLDGLYIDTLESPKLKDDRRTYIRDSSGKVIGESYGRASNDITRVQSQYTIDRCEEKDEISEMIENIRDRIYEYHHS